jgi:hypothetical protein
VVPSIKSWWLIVAFLSGLVFAMLAEDLILDARDNRLEFSAPRVHFLTGKPLDRLRNAAQVPFDFQVTLSSGTRANVVRRSYDRFVVSFDLWEETFSVSKLQLPRRQASHLTAPAAESWCLEQMAIEDVSGISLTEPLWARLEVRPQDPTRYSGLPFGRGNITDSGISLNSLVEIFSRPPPTPQSRFVLEAGPVTLAELRVRRPR